MDKKLNRQIIIAFWVIAIVFGGLQAWGSRSYMNPDGISYLDMGDAFFRGDLKMGVNAHWSPFYSWLVGLALYIFKPTPYWEFGLVHLVNFLIYLAALVCFHFLLLELIKNNKKNSLPRDGQTVLPESVFLAIGYTLFICSSLALVGLDLVTPDICTTLFIYLSMGIVLRSHRVGAGFFRSALLGVALGFGYLTKAPLFFVAFVFMGVSFFSPGNLRKRILSLVVCFAVFAVIAGTFITALHTTKGYWTFGDSGKYSYIILINKTLHRNHLHENKTDFGTAAHPMRRVFDKPAVYEFDGPVRGTYPAWYDPTYWYMGIEPRFDLAGQIKILMTSIKDWVYWILLSKIGFLFLPCFILYAASFKGGQLIKDIASQWRLLMPALAAMAMYSLILVRPRYVASCVVLLLLGLYSGVRILDSIRYRKTALKIISIVISITLIVTAAPLAIKTGKSFINQDDRHIHYEVAEGLKKSGIQAGDKLGFIGFTFGTYWARLAKVQIVIEVPKTHEDEFWGAQKDVQRQVIETFAKYKVAAIVSQTKPDEHSLDGWEEIGDTGHYIYSLTGYQ